MTDTTEMKSKFLLNPPTLYRICIILMVVTHFTIPIQIVAESPFSYGGGVLLFLGVWLAQKAKTTFRKTGTPLPPTADPVHLHTTGPFRHTRNPMYLGIMIGLLGIAVSLGSLVTFFFPILFWVIMDAVFIPFEEKQLEEAFGLRYDSYRSRVRRWI